MKERDVRREREREPKIVFFVPFIRGTVLYTRSPGLSLPSIPGSFSEVMETCRGKETASQNFAPLERRGEQGGAADGSKKSRFGFWGSRLSFFFATTTKRTTRFVHRRSLEIESELVAWLLDVWHCINPLPRFLFLSLLWASKVTTNNVKSSHIGSQYEYSKANKPKYFLRFN